MKPPRLLVVGTVKTLRNSYFPHPQQLFSRGVLLEYVATDVRARGFGDCESIDQKTVGFVLVVEFHT